MDQLEQKIEILSAQLITYKDDFDLERKDREIAQGKVASLEQQLRKMVFIYIIHLSNIWVPNEKIR